MPRSRSKAIAVPSGKGGYESLSIRPIDNGFIVSRSTDKGYSETYSPTKPKIEVPEMKSMSKAKASPKMPGKMAPKESTKVSQKATAATDSKPLGKIAPLQKSKTGSMGPVKKAANAGRRK